MFLSRSGALRQEVIAEAEVAGLVDLGKPFASAKDTRVQAVVLVRRPALARATYVATRGKALATVSRGELVATSARGWFVYRSAAERDLCRAMEVSSVPLGPACQVGSGMRTGNNPRHVGRREPRGR